LYVNSQRPEYFSISDPSSLDLLDYRGIEVHQLTDRRIEEPNVHFKNYSYHAYSIAYADGHFTNMYVNVDISKEIADEIVYEVAYFHGQLPKSLRENLDYLGVQPGTPNIGLGKGGYTFHLGYYRMSGNSMQHFLVHELAHIGLDWVQGINTPTSNRRNVEYVLPHSPITEKEWIEAAKLDGTFMTIYGEQNPLPKLNRYGFIEGSEDVADSLVFFVASRLATEQYHPKLLDLWGTANANRFAILERLDFTPPPIGSLSN
jgi:hypothetical protein